MADLTITASDVRAVRWGDDPHTQNAGAAVDAGAPIYLDANGYVQEAQADGTAAERAVIGIAVTTAAAANDTVQFAGPDSLVDLGDALSSVAFGATLYLSNTAGLIADGAGSVSVVLGTVVAVPHMSGASSVFDKLLRVSGALPGVVG
jgi:hypothetical protein